MTEQTVDTIPYRINRFSDSCLQKAIKIQNRKEFELENKK